MAVSCVVLAGLGSVVSGVVASLVTHYALMGLERGKEQRALVRRRIEALEERACGWLELLPKEPQSISTDAVQKVLFEAAYRRLERQLNGAQLKDLKESCPDIGNFSTADQARRQLQQLLHNLGRLYASVDKV